MAGTLSCSTIVFTSHNPWKSKTLNSSFLINIEKRALIRCSAKKKIGFFDQILDYIEGGPKLRKWYGATELLPKDGSVVEDQEKEDYPEDEVRDAVLVTDGDSEIGQKRALIRCSAKKKIGFFDQILDYIEGGPKLRKWYGATELLPKDGSVVEDQEEEDYPEDEVRDAVLVTDGDSEIGQMVVLSLIVKRTRVKALVKDKRSANEAFGTYVESVTGDTSNTIFVKKALRGVRAIICPNEGFLSSVESFKGVEHIILLSQLSVYIASSGIQAIMTKNQRDLAEKDEQILIASGIPHTIIRAGMLQNTPGGTHGFSFKEGSAASGSLSMEDAASICVLALKVIPQARFTFEVVNGGEKVSDWKECLTTLMKKTEQ